MELDDVRVVAVAKVMFGQRDTFDQRDTFELFLDEARECVIACDAVDPLRRDMLMATNLIAVEVAAGQSIVAQGYTWIGGMTVWIQADDVLSLEARGLVVPVGTYVQPVLSGENPPLPV